jgi:predicted AlkP superfamily phosphohydrolase/phosphomutase
MMLELDSLSLPFVRHHLQHLPTISGLVEADGVVETQSTAGIASASVWPTFSTGRLPGEHGHYFPFQWHAGRMSFYRTQSAAWDGALDYEPFWYELARAGVDCIVLDAVQAVPHPDPPCLEINDWSAQSHGGAQASSRELLRDLRRRFGRRPIGMEITVMKSRAQAVRQQQALLSSLRRKADAVIWLGQQRPWRFYLASVQDVHRAGHNLWPIQSDFASEVPQDALLTVYRALDHEISRIVEAFDDGQTDFILFTLNGMGPNRAQNHLLPQLLHRLNRLYVTGQREAGVSNQRRGTIARLRDHVPARLQYEANRMLGEQIQDWVVNREYTAGLEWSATPSFCVPTGGEGLIRLNLVGREKRGMLRADGAALRDYVAWLRDRMLAVKVSDTGEPLVRKFIVLSEEFPGNRSGLLPDIALDWAPSQPVTEVISDDTGTVRNRLKTGRGGNHTGGSFALFRGSFGGRPPPREIHHITDYRDYVRRLLL